MSPNAEESVVLSILNAWKFDGTASEVPWHITDAGWLVYTNHPNEKIRAAAVNHPYCNCPSRLLQQWRAEFRINVKEYS